MLVGVFHFPTDYGIDVRDLARALEERGFESLFVCEHTHIPASRRTPFPSGGELPKRYSHTHDPFIALSFAAAATRTLKLGTGVALVPERDPITTAKLVASLDQLSEGRFLFGIGGGWNAEEMENHGTRYETRFKLLRERVLAMKALWTQDEAQFHGELVRFDPVWLYPKPRQKPHPPILLGGETDHTLRRVAEFCDGWLPRARGDWQPGPRWRVCAGQPTRRAAIPPRSRSPCSMLPPMRRRWRLIVKRAYSARCSKCLTEAATRSCACWTRMHACYRVDAGAVSEGSTCMAEVVEYPTVQSSVGVAADRFPTRPFLSARRFLCHPRSLKNILTCFRKRRGSVHYAHAGWQPSNDACLGRLSRW